MGAIVFFACIFRMAMTAAWVCAWEVAAATAFVRQSMCAFRIRSETTNVFHYRTRNTNPTMFANMRSIGRFFRPYLFIWAYICYWHFEHKWSQSMSLRFPIPPATYNQLSRVGIRNFSHEGIASGAGMGSLIPKQVRKYGLRNPKKYHMAVFPVLRACS